MNNKSYINAIKVISIISVVIIHIISKIYINSDVVNTDFKIISFIDILIHFCVPLFVMSSGAIFLNRDDSPKKMILKYALKTYIIFIISNFIYKYIYYQVLSGHPFDLNGILNLFVSSVKLQSIFQLWYLRIIIILYILTPLIKLLKFNLYIDTIILIGLLLLTKTSLFINVISGYVFYYYAGYYFHKYSTKKTQYIFYILGIIALLYTYNMTIIASINSLIPEIKYIDYLTTNIMIYSISIFILIKNLSKRFDNRTNEIFDKLSKYVFGIYLIHGLVIGGLQQIKLIDIYNPNTNTIILLMQSLIVLILSFIIVYIYKKFKKHWKNI